MRGRTAFVWFARVEPIGIPLAGLAAARRLRRGDGTLAACRSAAVVLGLVLLAAELEFVWRRDRWRRAPRGERQPRMPLTSLRGRVRLTGVQDTSVQGKAPTPV